MHFFIFTWSPGVCTEFNECIPNNKYADRVTEKGARGNLPEIS